MSPTQPFVSVIIPAFNAATTIGAAIESILAQTYKNVELIIIDDGSRDATGAQVARYKNQKRAGPPIKLITNRQNLGAGASRQLAIAKAKGDYILWQDADDLSPPDRLARLMMVLQQQKNLMAVGSDFFIFRNRRGGDIIKKITAEKNSSPRGARPAPPLKLRIITADAPHLAIHFPTLLARRAAYDNCGFRPLIQGEDADWAYRLLERGGAIGVVGERLYYYRKHGGSLTKNHFEKFLLGMMVRLAHQARQKNLPDPLDTALANNRAARGGKGHIAIKGHHRPAPLITSKNFVQFYDNQTYPAMKKNIVAEVNWFLLENTRQALTRPWFFYKYIVAVARFFALAGGRHFFLTAGVFITRWPVNFLPYVLTRRIIW